MGEKLELRVGRRLDTQETTGSPSVRGYGHVEYIRPETNTTDILHSRKSIPTSIFCSRVSFVNDLLMGYSYDNLSSRFICALINHQLHRS